MTKDMECCAEGVRFGMRRKGRVVWVLIVIIFCDGCHNHMDELSAAVHT